MDPKRFAMVFGMLVLLPLFFGLFFDAVYESPEYDDFCNYTYPMAPAKPLVNRENCADVYNKPEVQACSREDGEPRFEYDESGCEVYSYCDYCSKDYKDAQARYNRNLFFILAPLGLIVIIIGIYFWIDYMGAGFMFGGLITLFYATVRYFSDMSKLLRAIVILIELLIIIWLGIKKIGTGKESPDVVIASAKPSRKTRKAKRRR
ncbi:hypothetical protein JW711_02920 [Candidatus Woesearchaeota archaeon]|nr:hypothetical protein [Candidatus Woesearchaeota archaeon]